MKPEFRQIEECLFKCWSLQTSTRWETRNPSRGQCGVTSLVINDLLGGEILKTRIDEQWHYYNRINRQRVDFTAQQFGHMIDYEDIESTREEALSDTNEMQYQHLKRSMEKELSGIKDRYNAEHYTWGNNSDGWYLVRSKDLSVILEQMPAGTREQLHYHEKAQQFFYILSGTATFDINGITAEVGQNQGIHVKPGTIHCISNLGEIPLEFIVISEPESHGDRINISGSI